MRSNDGKQTLDKTLKGTYTELTDYPAEKRTTMRQNIITCDNLTVIYGEQVVLGVWRG